MSLEGFHVILNFLSQNHTFIHNLNSFDMYIEYNGVRKYALSWTHISVLNIVKPIILEKKKTILKIAVQVKCFQKWVVDRWVPPPIPR